MNGNYQVNKFYVQERMNAHRIAARPIARCGRPGVKVAIAASSTSPSPMPYGFTTVPAG